MILARTDARYEHGLGEAIARAEKFYELGADILFVEAPKTVEEMRSVCTSLPGVKLANMVEGGETPTLSHAELHEIRLWHRIVSPDPHGGRDAGHDPGARGTAGTTPIARAR